MARFARTFAAVTFAFITASAAVATAQWAELPAIPEAAPQMAPQHGLLCVMLTCDDGDVCTVDECSDTAGCIHTPVNCDDGNVCTFDSCDANIGCVFEPAPPCDDGNACTDDVCDPVDGCISIPADDCDDGDACTHDWCDVATGCKNDTIPDCKPGTQCLDQEPTVYVTEFTDGQSTPIVDLSPIGAQQTVFYNGSGTVADIDAGVVIKHTWDGDLIVMLTSPSGTTVTLSNRNGGSGDDYATTTFDDEASQAIGNASAPFLGTFRPDEALSAFDGEPAAGAWTITVLDQASGDTGSLESIFIAFDVIAGCPTM